jgi:protein-S-isoprenylcysteine O-methyltransferase Ste14
VLTSLSAIFTGLGALIPGFDYRYQWSHVPFWLVVSACIIFELGFAMYIKVLQQNRYASRIIEIQENQKVIDYGLYAVVRHPMYAAISLTNMTMPLILGSYYGLIPVFFCLPIIFSRIKNEESILAKDLEGYKEYMQKVRYRLIPYIW